MDGKAERKGEAVTRGSRIIGPGDHFRTLERVRHIPACRRAGRQLKRDSQVTFATKALSNPRDEGTEMFCSPGTIGVSLEKLTATPAPEGRGLNIFGPRKLSGLAVGDAGRGEAM